MAFDGSNSGATNEMCIAYMTERASQQRRVDEERGVLRSIDKRYKALGVPVKAVRLANQLAKLEQDEAQVELRQFVQMSVLRGILPGPQLALFANIDTHVSPKAAADWELAQAENVGWQAGLDGASNDENPYKIGTELSQTWAKWRSRGAAAHARQAEPTEQQASTERKPPASRKAAAPEPAKAAKTGKAKAAPKKAAATGKRRGRPPGSGRRLDLPPPRLVASGNGSDHDGPSDPVAA